MTEYYQKMKTLMERAKIREEEEDTMSRFLGGLNREIAHPINKSSHIYLEYMYHYAIKIEEQLRGKKEHSKRYTSKSHTFSNSNV